MAFHFVANITEWLEKDSAVFLKAIGLSPADRVLDFGCGYGNYAIAVAQFLDSHGKVYAFDVDGEAIDYLNARAKSAEIEASIDIRRIEPGKQLPLPDSSV